jgi:hypothetical protein
MNRTEDLLKLRPKIKTIQQDLNTSETEQYQNNTLRPILKFQHDILLGLFRTSLTKNKARFTELNREEKEEKLNQIFQKDLSFKNQSIGAVIGILTLEEYEVYTSDMAAYNRRIVTMLKQRIMSTYQT